MTNVPRSGDVIHPQLWKFGSGYKTTLSRRTPFQIQYFDPASCSHLHALWFGTSFMGCFSWETRAASVCCFQCHGVFTISGIRWQGCVRAYILQSLIFCCLENVYTYCLPQCLIYEHPSSTPLRTVTKCKGAASLKHNAITSIYRKPMVSVPVTRGWSIVHIFAYMPYYAALNSDNTIHWCTHVFVSL